MIKRLLNRRTKVLKKQDSTPRKRISKKTRIDTTESDTLEQGKIVYIQRLPKPGKTLPPLEDIPGTWRYLAGDPSMNCGTNDFAKVECVDADLPYVVGEIYSVAVFRLSTQSWEPKG